MRTNRPQYNQLKDFENIVAWNVLSGNKGAIDLLREKIQMEKNMPSSEYELLEDTEKINWSSLSENPEAIKLLKENKYKIIWLNLSSNHSPKAIKLLKDQVEYENGLSKAQYAKLSNKISWRFLSSNPIAIDILAANKDKIKWEALSNNPKAIDILNANQDNIDWVVLSGNPDAIDILEANQDKINWEILSLNPSIFILK